MKNVSSFKGFFYLWGSLIFIYLGEARAENYSLSIFCKDVSQQKELYVYESVFAETPSKIEIRNIQNGSVVNRFEFLTIAAESQQIVIWQRPNNHGGSPTIFFATLQNGRLIGNGLGLKNANCFSVRD